MTTTYSVTWWMDLEAEDPVDAARQALAIHRDPTSWATVFTVETPTVTVDLDPEYTEPSGNGTPMVRPV